MEKTNDTDMGKCVSKPPKQHGNVSKIYVTRKDFSEEVKEDREKYLSMAIGDKRKLYKKGKFVLIDEVQTWQEYAPAVIRKINRETLEPEPDVNEVFNNKISLWKGDITTLEIDAIVNAANNSLLGGGGVDGAIHKAAGSKLDSECSTLGGCQTGDAKISGGYYLPAKYVIHTVGPIGNDPKKLSSCYNRCLEIVKEEKLRTVAFPCISTGIYGYDIQKATPVVLTTVRKWLRDNHENIDRIIFCIFLAKDVQVYEENLLKYFPIVKDGEKPGPTIKKAKTDSKTEKGESKNKEKETDKNSKSDVKAQKTVNSTTELTEGDKSVNADNTEGKLDGTKANLTEGDADNKKDEEFDNPSAKVTPGGNSRKDDESKEKLDGEAEKLTDSFKSAKDDKSKVEDPKKDKPVTRSNDKELKQKETDESVQNGKKTKDQEKNLNAVVNDSEVDTTEKESDRKMRLHTKL